MKKSQEKNEQASATKVKVEEEGSNNTALSVATETLVDDKDKAPGDEKVVEDVQNTGSVKAETVDQVELSATSGNKDEEKIVPEGEEKEEPATGILHEVLNNVVYPAVQAVQHAVFQEDGGDTFGTPRN